MFSAHQSKSRSKPHERRLIDRLVDLNGKEDAILTKPLADVVRDSAIGGRVRRRSKPETGSWASPQGEGDEGYDQLISVWGNVGDGSAIVQVQDLELAGQVWKDSGGLERIRRIKLEPHAPVHGQVACQPVERVA